MNMLGSDVDEAKLTRYVVPRAPLRRRWVIVRGNGSHTKPFFIEKDVRQGCIFYFHCSSVLTRASNERGRNNIIRLLYFSNANLKFRYDDSGKQSGRGPETISQ